MVELKLNLLNFEKFRDGYQTLRGRYSYLLSLSNIALLLALGIFISNLYLNNAVASLVGFILLFLSLIFQCFCDSDEIRLYKRIVKLLDTVDENGLFYYVKEDVLTTNNTIIKGLKYETIKGSCNQLRDSYENGKYKLILEMCDDTGRD